MCDDEVDLRINSRTVAMKLPMILVLVLGNAIAFAAQDTANNTPQNPSSIQEKTKRLELLITTDRQKYKRDGKITITAVITTVNTSKT